MALLGPKMWNQDESGGATSYRCKSHTALGPKRCNQYNAGRDSNLKRFWWHLLRQKTLKIKTQVLVRGVLDPRGQQGVKTRTKTSMIITKVDLKQQDSKGQRLKSEDNMNMASNDKGLIWSILILVENSSKTVFVIQ